VTLAGIHLRSWRLPARQSLKTRVRSCRPFAGRPQSCESSSFCRPLKLFSSSLKGCTFAGAVLFVPQFFVVNPWQLLVLQGAVGLVMSGVLTSISALQANLSPEGYQGAVYGVDASATSIANGIGPMIGAAVAAWLGLRAPFLLATAAFLVATAFAWALVPKTMQNKSPTG
jgi:MFS family permease